MTFEKIEHCNSQLHYARSGQLHYMYLRKPVLKPDSRLEIRRILLPDAVFCSLRLPGCRYVTGYNCPYCISCWRHGSCVNTALTGTDRAYTPRLPARIVRKHAPHWRERTVLRGHSQLMTPFDIWLLIKWALIANIIRRHCCANSVWRCQRQKQTLL